MAHYKDLNDIEKAIVNELTKGWYQDGNFSNESDLASMFLFASDSVKATESYISTPNVNSIDLMQAIVARYNHAVVRLEIA